MYVLILAGRRLYTSLYAFGMSQRNLRHKTVPVYDDDDDVQDEIDGKRTYDVQEKLLSLRYDGEFLLDLQGQDLTFERVQRLGLSDPIRIKNKDGLGTSTQHVLVLL